MTHASVDVGKGEHLFAALPLVGQTGMGIMWISMEVS